MTVPSNVTLSYSNYIICIVIDNFKEEKPTGIDSARLPVTIIKGMHLKLSSRMNV